MGNTPKGNRPLLISLIAILEFVGGILTILLGALAGSLLSASFAGLGSILGILFIVFGLIALAWGYGFWTGAKWGWWIGIILYALGVISSLASIVVGSVFSIVGLIVDVLLIYYMTRPNVKAWFGV